MNQTFEQWCGNAENYKDNLKIVMWRGVKIPVKNFMCPVCNSPSKLKALKMASLVDPECTHPETQKIIHDCRGWSNCSLAIKDNVLYHADCLKKKLKSRFDKLLKSGEIFVETS